MTSRLYYNDPALHEFDTVIEETIPSSNGQPRTGVVLRESAFYPTSGGQVYDTGWLLTDEGERVRVAEVAESEDGKVIHYLEGTAKNLPAGASVHGSIDPEGRRDHMQQHSGQHVLSAVFIELYEMPTLSFHMGEDACSIDLAKAAISPEQIAAAERRANEIIFENRPVRIRFVSRSEAEKLGLRKLPPDERDELRLIEIADFDLSACGGTHVSATGQVGCILLRKTEKVKQGTRVEFVCGGRAVAVARRDYAALTEAAGLFSAQLWDVPAQIRKNFAEAKTLRRERDEALDQLAEAMASAAAQDTASGRKLIVRVFRDHDIAFAKLFAQKATRAGVPAIALVASTVGSPGLVFAQSAGGAADMGALLKQVLASVGGRGGGSRDFAQGGVPAGSNVEQLLRQAADTIGSQGAGL
jgi:alanyl-tRNA synthetase